VSVLYQYKDIKMLFHKGERFQSGRGIESLFAGLFRTLKPLFSMGLSAGKKVLASSAAKELGNTALDIGKSAAKNLAADLLEGKNMNESLNKELDTAKAKIATKIRGGGRKRRALRLDNEKTLRGILSSKRKKYNLLY
jgi:hypothetical protein